MLTKPSLTIIMRVGLRHDSFKGIVKFHLCLKLACVLYLFYSLSEKRTIQNKDKKQTNKQNINNQNKEKRKRNENVYNVHVMLNVTDFRG